MGGGAVLVGAGSIPSAGAHEDLVPYPLSENIIIRFHLIMGAARC